MSLFTIFKNNPPMESLKRLIIVQHDTEADIIKNLLDGEGIPVFIRGRDFSSATKLYTGFSSFGIDIFVDEGDLEKAQEILAAFRTETGEDWTGGEISEEELEKQAMSSPTAEPTEERDSLGLLLPIAAMLLVLGIVGLFIISRLWP